MNIQMQMPETVIIDDNSNDNHGVFSLQPLEKGYGVTLGNSLRRVYNGKYSTRLRSDKEPITINSNFEK